MKLDVMAVQAAAAVLVLRLQQAFPAQAHQVREITADEHMVVLRTSAQAAVALEQ
jgi:hypothetical protein